ncbi:MAG: hypothetical protein P8R54_06575 [Myxococcota bacterium]|nr:hypothetical protein [Myxococcota bacterium]
MLAHAHPESSMTALTFRLTHPCVRCQRALPLRTLCDRTCCVACGHDTPLTEDAWREKLPRAAVAAILLGGRPSEGALSHQPPCCRACQRPVALAALADAVPSGGLRCACGEHISVRAADALTARLVPGAVFIVSEQGPPAAASPVLFACMGCGSAMSADGRRRVEDCGRCQAANYLPDDLWRALHPVEDAVSITVVSRLTAADRRALSLESPASARALAMTTSLDPALWPLLAAHPAPSVRAAVAGNPAAAVSLRLPLAADPDPTVRAAVVDCRAAHSRLLLDAEPSVRAALAASRHTPPDALSRLAEDPALIVRIAVAQAEGTPDAALCAMVALESDETVLLALLSRPVLPDALLTAMAVPSQTARIARHIAALPELPHAAATQLAGHFEDTVRQTLLDRDDLPVRALRTLAADAVPGLRQQARAHPDYVVARRQRRRVTLALSSALVLLSGMGGLLGAVLLASQFSDELLRLMP